MGQYHTLVNLDKKQFIYSHALGTGLKLWEHLANHPGTGAALLVLLASGSNGDGSGDLKTGPTIIGQWRGDRIAMVGDYDEHTNYLVDGKVISGDRIYAACSEAFHGDDDGKPIVNAWTDVSSEVCAVIERELDGTFRGEGWREFQYNTADTPAERAMKPDMVIGLRR